MFYKKRFENLGKFGKYNFQKIGSDEYANFFHETKKLMKILS